MKQETADRITAELDKAGWCQGTYRNADGKICLTEAVYRVFRQDITGSNRTGNWRAVPPVRAELDRKAQELFPDRMPYLNAMAFNDHKDTTEEDVRLVIKHCVEE